MFCMDIMLLFFLPPGSISRPPHILKATRLVLLTGLNASTKSAEHLQVVVISGHL